jgi:phosphoglycolate phosphatase
MWPRLLVCDLDNTLYDWVSFFVPAFYAMVDSAVGILCCDREQLLDDLRIVHQKYHDSEHPFALLETTTVNRVLPNYSVDERREILDPAFKAFNSVRKQNLRLYPGVEQTLRLLQNAGVRLVAHSESGLYSVVFRLKFLRLTQYFERIYCIERPEGTLADTTRRDSFLADFPAFKLHELSHHQRKPNPEVLAEMFSDFAAKPRDCAYIGDSLPKDVYMAKRANCFAIWAKYGTDHPAVEYAKLVRISHWTAEEVSRENDLRETTRSVMPDCIAQHSFADVVDCLNSWGTRGQGVHSPVAR